MVAALTQAGRTRTYTLDPARRVLTTADTAGPTLTNHFTAGGDNPAWIGSSDGTWTRYLDAPAGGLALTVDNTGAVVLNLANLHGDVATAAVTDTSPATYAETTEYGLPRDPAGANRRYGWLGTHQRNTGDTLAHLTLMGVRLYNPTTGRFLQVDPVYGGSANDYDYCNGDPINCTDLDGRCPLPGPICWGYNAGSYAAWRYRGSPTITARYTGRIRVGRAPSVPRIAPGRTPSKNSNAYSGPSWGYRIMYTDSHGKRDVYKWGITSVYPPHLRAGISQLQCTLEGYKRCKIAQIRTFRTRIAARMWEYNNCVAYVFAFGRRPVGMKRSCR